MGKSAQVRWDELRPSFLLTHLHLQDEVWDLGVVSWYEMYHRGRDVREYKKFLIFSPNAGWCPDIRTFNSPVCLRTDGTFGFDDPVCWPQYHNPDAPHFPCIASADPDPKSPVYLFRRGLLKEQVKLTNSFEDGLHVGVLSDDLIGNLNSAVSKMTERATAFLSAVDQPHPRLQWLVTSLTATAKKLSACLAPVPELRIAFGLVSRFFFECHGYIEYHTNYLPRLASTDVPAVEANAIGVWVRSAAAATHYRRMGIPVWLVFDARLVRFPLEKVVKAVVYQKRIRCPGDSYRDDGYISGQVPLFLKREGNPSVLLKAIDSWASKKLEEDCQ